MSSERKKLYACVLINFLLGTILGTILFHAHMKSNAYIPAGELSYEKTLSSVDFFRVWWINILWLISVFMAHTILPWNALHVIVGVRGSVNSFSLMYLYELFGIKETVASVLPQCFSVLPMMMYFSVLCVERRIKNKKAGRDPYSINRKETATVFLMAAIAASVETVLFAILSKILL